MTSLPPQTNANRGPVVIGVVSTVASLATVAVVLRLISRKLKKLTFRADDYLILLSLPFTLALSGTVAVATHYGLGRHITTLNPTELAPLLKHAVATGFLFPTTVSLIKLSVLLFYVRLFPQPSLHIIAYILGLISILWSVSIIILQSLECRPLRFFWDKTISGTCINARDGYMYSALPDIVMDFIILALPQPIIWKLQTRKSQKIILIAIFSLGALTCCFSIIRVTSFKDFSTIDQSWEGAFPEMWTAAEAGVGTLAACLPCMRPLIPFISSKLSSLKSLRYYSVHITKREAPLTESADDSVQKLRRTSTILSEQSGLNNNMRRGSELVMDRSFATIPMNHYPENTIRVQNDVEWSTANMV